MMPKDEPRQLEARAMANPARPEIGIVLIAHGSRRPEANRDLFALAERFRASGYPRTYAAFLELAEPSIPEAGDQCIEAGARLVILTPYFLSAGQHVVRDLENFRLDLETRHPGTEIRLANPLGPHPLLDEILRQRIAATLSPLPEPENSAI
jgi:sirohydrochlorin ferrochelatase